MKFLDHVDLEKRFQKHDEAIAEFRRDVKERDDIVNEEVFKLKEAREVIQACVRNAQAELVHLEALDDVPTKFRTTHITDVD